MSKRLEIKKGDRFHSLVILQEIEPATWGPHHTYRRFLCECDCGKILPVRMGNIRSGCTTSCGCVAKRKLAEANEGKKTKVSAGARFGHWTVIKELDAHICPSGKTSRGVECKCDCGKIKRVHLAEIVSGGSTSCRCYANKSLALRSRTHGMKGTFTYNVWMTMKARCDPRNASIRPRYAAIGISVCKEWDSFSNFFKDMGVRPPDKTLDRIDNTRGYCKENCQWSDSHTQNNNKSNTRHVTLLGKTKPLMTWCRELGISKSALLFRIRNWGGDDSRITSEPLRKNKRRKRPIPT